MTTLTLFSLRYITCNNRRLCVSKISKIVFVWNADFSIAGGLNAIQEVVSGHHTCTLCAIAYHRVMQTKEWTHYKRELASKLNADIRQPCRNQLNPKELAAAQQDFPVVLAYTNSTVIRLLGSHDIDSCDGDFYRFKEKLDAAIREVCPAAFL